MMVSLINPLTNPPVLTRHSRTSEWDDQPSQVTANHSSHPHCAALWTESVQEQMKALQLLASDKERGTFIYHYSL